jgi:hypothetical protein
MNLAIGRPTLFRGLSALALCLLAGCSHPEPRTNQASGPTWGRPGVAGDSETNAVIVPASASREVPRRSPAIVNPNVFPFPEYDARLARAVNDRWYTLLSAYNAPPIDGNVVVEFLLHERGSVSSLRTLTSDVPPQLQAMCERAVLDVAPFPTWPAAMKDKVGKDVRLVRFTFSFNGAPQTSQSN